MRKNFRRLVALMLVLFTLFTLTAQGGTEKSGQYSGKTVILHSNDVHGAVEGYAYIKALKDDFTSKGASVILADAGDFSQGTTYVSTTKGMDAVTMMNAAGYDVATLGNHEFDYGYAQLKENLSKADFKVLCSNVFTEDGNPIYDSGVIIRVGSLRIGFFGVETPEAQTKANPALIKGLKFLAGEDMYRQVQAVVDSLKEKGADVVIGLVHLGVDGESTPNRSTDLMANVKGIDMLIDGHSHTVMEKGENGEPIQSTGTAFANIGVIVIDNATAKIEGNWLISTEGLEKDEAVSAEAKLIVDRVNAEYDIVFASSLVELNGDREPGNRTEETNLGDLITDAMMWTILKEEGALSVDEGHTVAVTNGGGIRAWIHAGDITKKDVNTVLPFGNTIAVVYVKGSDLLEALEASTYCTPISLGGFPQVSGLEYTIDTTKSYDKNSETYPASTYYGPASIQRVTITGVNGTPFNADDTYAVITNNFVAAGGDTYYAFASSTNQFDTGIVLDEAVMDYITEVLGGVVGEKYAEPQGRITVITEESEDDGVITIGGLDSDIWFTKYGNVYLDIQVASFFDLGYSEGDEVKVSFLDKELVLPVVPTYSYVDQGTAAIIAPLGENGKPTGYLSLAINMGNFGETYGLAYKTTNADKTWFWTAYEGVKFPVEVKFEMSEKGGYLSQYILHDLTRTNNRADYPELTDEEFANFREIDTTGMGKGKLYRTSSPIDPSLGRNTYADKAIEKAGVTVIMNLANSESDALAFEGFSSSYYSKEKVIYLNLGVDFQAAEFKSGLAQGLRFFAENKGVYAFHCTEGKDRAGFVAALLECLMGATYDEVCADYMKTYENYYKVEKGSDKYNAILSSNIVKTLQAAFGVEDLSSADLASAAEGYIRSIGLSESEIASLKANLS